jgi:NB-ARC domain/Domain of unknown function (DUF4062)
VFLSHTGELARFPEGRSYVCVASDAVKHAGHYPIDMAHFPNRDVKPSEIDRDRLSSCHVYVGIFGFRWGSACSTNSERSYTEEEYEMAGELGIPRRIFLLDERSSELGISPVELGYEEDTYPKQKAFRERVRKRVVTLVHSPEHLATVIATSLADLERQVRTKGEASTRAVSERRRHNIPVHGDAVVRRDAKIDEVIELLMSGRAVRMTSMRGAGGVGKTILAEQVCRDPRVVEAFPGGTWKVTIGEHPDAEQIARELYRIVTGRNASGDVSPLIQLSDAFTQGRTLVLFDDVWPPDAVARELMGAFADEVSVLITTRGVVIPGAETVNVDELTRDEARRLLMGPLADTAPPAVLSAADEVIDVLGSWALLVDMAARLIADDLSAAPDAVADTFRSLASEFRHHPTMLDDKSSRDRSFARIVTRSVAALGEPDRERFTRLSVFPPDAELGLEVLADSWACGPFEARKTKQALERVGLSRAFLDPPRLGLHDLLTAWLHHTSGPPGTHPDWHLSCLRNVIDVNGSPLALTIDRATWLFHHLHCAREWDMLAKLPTMSWRETFFDATGSDALFLETLGRYATVTCTDLDASNAAREVARTTIFTAHVRRIVRDWPLPLLVTMALLESPSNALNQAALHARQACAAIAAIVRAIADKPEADDLLYQALQLLIDQREDALSTRSAALRTVIGRIIAREVAKGAVVEAVVSRYTAVEALVASDVLVCAAEAIAGVDSAKASRLLDEADRLARAMPDGLERDWALARVASSVASLDPTSPDFVARALALPKLVSGSFVRWATVSDVVTGLARRSTADRDFLSTAEELARRIDDEDFRIEARAEVAQGLARLDPSDQKLVARAVRMARAISRHEAYALTRAGAIAGIGIELARTRPTRAMQLLDEAATVVQAIPRPVDRISGLATLAARIASVAPTRTSELFERAATEAMSLDAAGDRIEALSTVAKEIVPVDPARARQLFEQARTSISSTVDVGGGDDALATMSRRMAASDPLSHEAVRRALLLARRIPQGATLARALAGIAEQITHHDGERADALFGETTDLIRSSTGSDWASERAAAEIAERIAGSDAASPAVVSRALGVVENLHFPHRCHALAGIGARIARSQPARAEQLFAAAELVVATMEDDSDGIRDDAVACIAVRRLASEAINPTAISRAEARVSALPSWRRLPALADIVEQVSADPNLDASSIEEALRLTRSIVADGLPDIGSRTLASIAVRLPVGDQAAALFQEAAALAQSTHHYSRKKAMAYVAGCRRDLPSLLSLLKFDVEVAQIGECLGIMKYFVEGAERADTHLACAVCTGVYLAIFETATT